MVETLQEFSAALRLKGKVFIERCGVLCDQALPRPHLSDLISSFLGPPHPSHNDLLCSSLRLGLCFLLIYI